MYRRVGLVLAVMQATVWGTAARAEGEPPPADLSPIVVTATRVAESSFDVAASDRPGRRGGDSGGSARGEHLRVLDDRARRVGREPAKLCSGPAALGARLRRTLELRRARRAPVLRRHPGNHAGRPGRVLAVRSGLRRPDGSAARTLLRALRQLLGRSDLAVHRGSAGRLFHRRYRAIRHVQHAALCAEDDRR